MELFWIGILSRWEKFVVEREGESSNQPAVAAPQLWRGTRFSCASSRLAAPKRKQRRVAERKKVRRRRARGAEAMPPSAGRGAFKLYFFHDHQ
jgi:hypothetical protein